MGLETNEDLLEIQKQFPTVLDDLGWMTQKHYEHHQPDAEHDHWTTHIAMQCGMDLVEFRERSRYWREKSEGNDLIVQNSIYSRVTDGEVSIRPNQARFVGLPPVEQIQAPIDEIYAGLYDSISAEDWSRKNAAIRYLRNDAPRSPYEPPGFVERGVDWRYAGYPNVGYLVDVGEDETADHHLDFILKRREVKLEIFEVYHEADKIRLKKGS